MISTDIVKQAKNDEIDFGDKKLRSAYALNLCTVSVSQIIDYNDIVILEQEYEAILNNLNIEQMPKDEALLNILKQLLDTITFFRIQEGDKVFIDKEYQHKMKKRYGNFIKQQLSSSMGSEESFLILRGGLLTSTSSRIATDSQNVR